MSNREEQASGHRPEQGPISSSSGRGRPNLQPQLSPNSTRIPRQRSYSSFQTQNDTDAGSHRPATAQESRRAHAQANSLSKQQTAKNSDDRFYVDNTYFDLNPWYDEEPKKPLFGMSRPFPRTVRPGMLWGRNRTRQTAGEEEQGIGSNVARPTLRIPLHENEDSPPDEFDAEIGGNYYAVQRMVPQEQEMGDEKSGASARREEHSTEADEKALRSPRPAPRHRRVAAYSGGLSPLEETRSDQSSRTYKTEKEKKETQRHTEEALQTYYNKYRNPLARLRAKYPEVPAEFLCTMIYVFFGITGSLYAMIYPATPGDYQTPAWAWGVAVMAGIYVGGGISGAHMSPWVSVCFAIFRGFPWKMTLVYSIAQLLGGFVAGALAWAVYQDGIRHVDPGLTQSATGMAFYSTPSSYVSLSTAFFNNFLSAALYVCVAFAVGDDSNTPPGSGMSALVYGLLTYLLTITMGYNGLGISPARDLGPRFVAWWAGYGTTFSTRWWAYGPILGGLSGSIVGALIYDVLIFTGGESPVNYSWPTTEDIKNRVFPRKEQEKQRSEEVSV